MLETMCSVTARDGMVSFTLYRLDGFPRNWLHNSWSLNTVRHPAVGLASGAVPRRIEAPLTLREYISAIPRKSHTTARYRYRHSHESLVVRH